MLLAREAIRRKSVVGKIGGRGYGGDNVRGPGVKQRLSGGKSRVSPDEMR